MSFRRILNRVAVASGVTATSAIIATKRNISARDYQKNETFIDHKYDLDWDKLPNHNGLVRRTYSQNDQFFSVRG